MRTSIALSATILALAASSSAAFAESGWTKDSGDLYLKLGLSTFRSESYYTLDGALREGNAFAQSTLNLYVEYGLFDHLTLIVHAPLIKLQSFANTDFVAGNGDLRIELKAGVELGGFHLALSVSPELPIGRSTALAEDREIAGTQINIPLGDGELNTWILAAVSRSFSALDAYASLFAGYDLRSGGFGDELLAGVEVGHQLFSTLWLRGQLRVLRPIRDQPLRSVPFIFGEGSQYLSFSLGASLPIGRGFSIDLDYSNLVALRKNVYGGSSAQLGVALDL